MKMEICEGSRLQVDTDHDRILFTGTVTGPGRAKVKARAGGALQVTRPPPPTTDVSPDGLAALARQHCKPASLGEKFRASAATRTFREIAKAGRDAESWKRYLTQLRMEKEEWKGARIERASADWGLYKTLTKNKTSWGDEYMMACGSDNPVEDIKAHFEEVFHDASQGDIHQELAGVAETLALGAEVQLFSAAEVRRAVLSGKNGKATGPDCVPTELLKVMMENDTSVTAFQEYFNDILTTGNVPQSWDQSVVALLPKVVPPATAKQLRPIALASHVSKAYARLLMARLQEELRPQGEHQLAGAGRQAADFVSVAVKLTHLCREWHADCYILKLDLQRAFDSVNRVRLAGKLCEWSGGAKPHETRSLIRLLASTDLILHLPWEQHSIVSNVGVKQGATESPTLFARLLDDLLGKVALGDDDKVLDDLPHDSAVFIDDVLVWKRSVKGLQKYVDRLLPLLAEFGLVVQPTKCKLLCLRGSRRATLLLDGKPINVLPEDEVLNVMNLPLGVVCTEQNILEAMVDKARGKFYGIAHILCSNAPLSARFRVLRAVVFGAIRWSLGVLVPTPQAQQTLNFFQCNCIRRMLGIKRVATETWPDYEARSLRIARAKVYQMKWKRWGDRHLEAFWRYTGHVVREGQRHGATVAGILANFRPITWWDQQQRGSGGARHRRHFPHLMNTERKFSRVTGSLAWRVATANRSQWKALEGSWIAQESIPWSSGRQPAIAA